MAADLHPTEFAVILGLARGGWTFLHQPGHPGRLIEAHRDGHTLNLTITPPKVKATLDGQHVQQRKLRQIIERGNP
ncbi:hypothetical protein [Glutamicibacter creatinolyticus]|uniref:hypothetical protein n=1 Tax=Glutamicibacter creatinolyticus TaxID=162496 RepID=UPI003216243D